MPEPAREPTPARIEAQIAACTVSSSGTSVRVRAPATKGYEMTLRTSLLSAAMLCAAAPAFAAGIGMSGNTSTMITPPAATTSATGNVTAPVPSAAPVTGTVRNTAGTTAGAAVNGTGATGDVSTGVNADTNGNTAAGVD